MAKPYVAYLESLSPEQHRFLFRQMRIQSILMPELRQWQLPMAERRLRSQVVPMLSALFTQKDRQALADIAAQGIAQGVLQMAQVDNTCQRLGYGEAAKDLAA
ncbi:MAG: hypothetical protein F6K19_38990 [Cyanothece sp. SIO1E1]|nr:hypothetical protein [Cyanothece sp. SIO1E1]